VPRSPTGCTVIAQPASAEGNWRIWPVFAEKAGSPAAIIPKIFFRRHGAASSRPPRRRPLYELRSPNSPSCTTQPQGRRPSSGTCSRPPELESRRCGKSFSCPQVEEHETLAAAAAGQRESGLRLHSIRLAGLVAHQGSDVRALAKPTCWRHDTIDRSAYMPGVAADRAAGAPASNGLVYGPPNDCL